MNFDQLFGNTGDGVYVVGMDGAILFWNEAAERILGYSSRDVVGMRCDNILKGRDVSCNRVCHECCSVQTQVKGGEPVNHFEMSSETSRGKPVWLDVSIIKVLGSSGVPKAIVHMIRDTTLFHDLQTLLREKLNQIGPEPAAEPDPAPSTGLTVREREVLMLLKQGANTAKTAERLYISRATVRNHIQNIFSKLGVHTRLEAVAYINGRRL